MNNLALYRALNALLSLVLLASLPQFSFAQKREHLTPEEIELVRDTQELDRRTAVFIKAAERRLLAATNPDAWAKQSAKDVEKWGEVKGTRTQLLSDITKILDEAVVNIDDAAMRDAKSSLLHKSLNKLAEAVNRFTPQLAPMRDGAQSIAEREAVEEAIEKAQEIAEAAGRHKSNAPQANGKKQDKNN